MKIFADQKVREGETLPRWLGASAPGCPEKGCVGGYTIFVEAVPLFSGAVILPL